MEKKLDGNYTRMLQAVMNKSWGNTLQKRICTATYQPSWKPSKLDEPDMLDTAREISTNS